MRIIMEWKFKLNWMTNDVHTHTAHEHRSIHLKPLNAVKYVFHETFNTIPLKSSGESSFIFSLFQHTLCVCVLARFRIKITRTIVKYKCIPHEICATTTTTKKTSTGRKHNIHGNNLIRNLIISGCVLSMCHGRRSRIDDIFLKYHGNVYEQPRYVYKIGI